MSNVRLSLITVAILLLLLVFLPGPAWAEEAISAKKNMQKAILWALIPGGGHYYLGETKTAGIYAGSTLSLTGVGYWLNERNKELGHDDEVNTFWLLAMKGWELSFFTTYRSAFRHEGYDLKSVGSMTPRFQIYF